MSDHLGAPPERERPHHERHRDRLRVRFNAAGPGAPAILNAFHEYEILEIILSRVFRRGDVKPLAKRLIARFGSLTQTIAAPRAHILEVEGAGPRTAEELRLFHAVAVAFTRRPVTRSTVLSSWRALLDYCTTALANEDAECLHVLFLNASNHLITDETLHRGTVNRTPLYPREILRRALQLNATAFILVHNHPGGNPTPSHSDIAATKAVARAAQELGIALHDHIIVASGTSVSFKDLGLL